jgi:hypothetical protein
MATKGVGGMTIAEIAHMVAWQLRKHGEPTTQRAEEWLSEEQYTRGIAWVPEGQWRAFARAFKAEVNRMRHDGMI